MLLTRAGVALAAVAALLVGPADAVPIAPDAHEPSGAGDPYWPLDGNRGIDVRHYDIAVAYDFATGRLTGDTTVTLRATEDLAAFHLDLLLRAQAVTVDGTPAGFARGGGGHELVVTPATPVPRGSVVEVRVTYAGKPGRATYAGEGSWLADSHEVVTMGEPHMAPWWFPADDHPADKATYDVTVTGPASHQVISNGEPVGRTVEGTTATTHWRSTEPMASYLAFFALGRFRLEHGVHEGRPWWIAVSQQLSPSARAGSLRSLRLTPQVTDWLERRLGPYPFSSTGGLATSLPVRFALENQTRPTYPAATLGGGPSILVHELAHQWFGDSVSVRRWRDVWLNEGFAHFMEKAYAERHGGRSAASWLQRTYRDARCYYPTSFWAVDLADPGRGRIFDDAVYVRGAMALQALRNRVGNHDFWQVLRTWVRERRHGLGTVPAFQHLVTRVTGQRLDGFWHAWLRAPRPPRDVRSNGLG